MEVDSTLLLNQLAEHGGLIGILIFLLFASMSTTVMFLVAHIIRLQKRLDKVQDSRIDDAREVRGELIAQQEDFSRSLGEVGAAVQGVRDAVILGSRPSSRNDHR